VSSLKDLTDQQAKQLNLGFFTYWSQRAKNKQWNKGLRLDYTLVSKGLWESGKVKEAFILQKYTNEFGDHCPVGLTLAP